MKFAKLPHEEYNKSSFLSDKSDSLLVWVSDDYKYMIMLIDGAKSGNTPEYYHENCDYIRFCTMVPGRDVSTVEESVARILCQKDGVTAFVVHELIDISCKHDWRGGRVVEKRVKRFAKRMCEDTLSIKPPIGLAHIDLSWDWWVAALPLYQVYKEKYGSKI